MLAAGLLTEYFGSMFFTNTVQIIWYGIAYIPVGWPVIKAGWNTIKRRDIFTEFFLMTVATVGAFAIGKYPESVSVMLFYSVGELFQGAAVRKAKGNIKALLDVRPKEAHVLRNGQYTLVSPESVGIGETLQIRVGEKIPLDGVLISEKARLNTAALTGESKPQSVVEGEEVYSGSINLEGLIEVKVTKEFKDSSISRILDMVQNATSRKSKTELFIRRFTRVYTPIVVYLALALTIIPFFFVDEYVFSDWLYRALIFLVISCPCALVVSIPLGYFGGLGAASKNGILFKGASFLDVIAKVKTLVFDKTGTLTKGVFEIQEIHVTSGNKKELMSYLKAIEGKSTHPIAKAITDYDMDIDQFKVSDVQEVAGKGLIGVVNNKKILAGNLSLMKGNGISVDEKTQNIEESVVMLAIDSELKGYVVIADALKDDAKATIAGLKKLGISDLVMLSGDRESVTQKIAQDLQIDSAKGNLLPEDKLREVENLQKNSKHKLAFIGDGINDAPVLALSDVGIAMGGLGSDVAIETADVVIQTDHPSKVIKAIKIGRSTGHIVWQNIIMALGVKLVVLILGAGGLATMWEAVFADVGVALLAILNAVRLQHMRWD